MKLTTQQTETGFKPVSFTVTCETQQELDFWAKLFNNAAFYDSFLGFTGKEMDRIYGKLNSIGGNERDTEKLFIKYQK